MSDGRLRELERRWLETGSPQDRRAYEQARRRAGLPRLVVRHYIDPVHHGLLNENGEFSLSKNDGWHHMGGGGIRSLCNVHIWPRDYHTLRKSCFYTEDESEVTCKTCLRVLSKPRFRTHYAPGSKATGAGIPVCGRNDSDKFSVKLSHQMRGVTCPACKLIMQRGRRAARRTFSHGHAYIEM